MDNENDVDRLFSWLQTPELRYREFAGTREINDAAVIEQVRATTPDPEPKPHHNAQLAEEYPEDQFPDQAAVHVKIEPAPVIGESPRTVPLAPPTDDGPSTLGSAGRGGPRRPEFMEPLAPTHENPPPIAESSAPPPASRVSDPPSPPVAEPAPPVAPPPAQTAPPLVHESAATAAGAHLLGGAYRNDGPPETAAAAPPAPERPPSSEGQQHGERSLDKVFGRLAASRDRLPDPRERLRHIPGLGPHGGRPR